MTDPADALMAALADELVQEEAYYDYDLRNAMRAHARNIFRRKLRPLAEALIADRDRLRDALEDGQIREFIRNAQRNPYNNDDWYGRGERLLKRIEAALGATEETPQ